VRRLSEVVLLAASLAAAQKLTRRITPISLRKLLQSLQRPEQPPAAHPLAPRRRQIARVPRVRQDVRHLQRTQAAHAHPLERQAVPVRSLPQGVYPVLKPLQTQENARRLQVSFKQTLYTTSDIHKKVFFIVSKFHLFVFI
jgi:hypothetical protein